MKLKYFSIMAILLIAVVLVSGCTNQEITCNSPYIKVGNICCLDSNHNNICDTDETPTTSQQQKQQTYCSDGICQSNEDCSSCSQDCGECKPTEYCGDDICQSNEDCNGCPMDCPICFYVGEARGTSAKYHTGNEIGFTSDIAMVPNVQISIRAPSNKAVKNIKYSFYCSGNKGTFNSENGKIETITWNDKILKGNSLYVENDNLKISSHFSKHIEDSSIYDTGKDYGQEILLLPSKESTTFTMSFKPQSNMGSEYIDPSNTFYVDCTITFMSENPIESISKQFRLRYYKE